MDPKNPKILYAAAYDKERKPWTFNLAGPGSGIYKTIDAGKTWTKLAGGLPGGMLGRIGLDVYAKNPLILYANIENANKPGMSDADRLKELRDGKSSAGMIGEEVYRSDDGGKTWKKVSPDKQKIGGGPGYYYMQIRVDPNDANHVYVLTVGVTHSTDGGKTWTSPFRFGGDNHAHVDRPGELEAHAPRLRPRHGRSPTTAAQNWYHPDELPLAQFYAIGYRQPACPTTSTAACRTTARCAGPSTKRGGRPIVFEDWQTVGGGDGFYNVFDTVTNRYLYNESQFGSISRTDLYTGETKSIRHRDQTLRFNWNAPILVSPHDSNVVYHAANKLLKSAYRGECWAEISPDLTTNDKTKLTVPARGRTRAATATSSTARSRPIDESPIVRDLLWVGTDDGNVWVTKDGGGQELDEAERQDHGQPGLLGEPRGRVAAPAGHGVRDLHGPPERRLPRRSSTRRPTTARRGRRLSATCRTKSINVIREDPKNPNLLFVGMDFGLYVTIDGGKTWKEMKGNMPDAAGPRPEDPPARARPDRRPRTAAASSSPTSRALEEINDKVLARTSTCSTSSRR